MVNIERDINGKTRVAKGDKSGLGGQYAPDLEALKRHADNAKKLTFNSPTHAGADSLTMEEYNSAVESRDIIVKHYEQYNEEQQKIANSVNPEEYIQDDNFTYFTEFTPDTPYKDFLRQPRDEEGQPKVWSLRVGTKGSSSDSGLGFFTTREDALNAVQELKNARSSNSYVQQELKKYNPEREKKEAVRLPSSTPKGPWDMIITFIEPVPHATKIKENGYHSGWCLTAVSENYHDGEPVFINHEGYHTREDAIAAKDLVLSTIDYWSENKDRVIFVEGQGNILYNHMSHEQYERTINHYGFKPRPWAASDMFINYE